MRPSLVSLTSLAPLALVAALVLALVAPGQAGAVERNFAGSAQIDYHFVPSQRDANARANAEAFDGFTTELSLKVAVDFNEHLSANVKICYGCHGFETDMAYFDYRIADELNFRLGRFSPSFGAFNLRHDVANHRLSDKPLPYDMGRMLRLRTWNMGVLPSPFPDNGLEINGTHWFGESVQLDYAAYVVSGFKGDSSSLDLDFIQSRTGNVYYVDNNARPSFGGRAALTFKLSSTSDATLGASGLYGTFDPKNELAYAIIGGDLTFRIDRTNIRLEYLARRQEFDVSERAKFKFLVPEKDGDFFVKHGAYVELEQPITKDVDLIGRVDGMFRVGNSAAASDLKRKSFVIRETLGTSIALERGLRLKVSTELWQFSEPDPTGHDLDLGFHVAGVGAF
jgi:hypothetical protein